MDKDKKLKCVYCGALINWGLCCEDCGRKEDEYDESAEFHICEDYKFGDK